MLGVSVASGVAVVVAVSVGNGVLVTVGVGEIVAVGGNGVFVPVSIGEKVDVSGELHPAIVRARTASPTRTGSPVCFQRVIMGAIIPLW